LPRPRTRRPEPRSPRVQRRQPAAARRRGRADARAGAARIPRLPRRVSRERTRLAAAALALCVVAGASTAAGQASVFVGHSGWFWANPLPQGNTLRALDFAGERGYAVGDFGTVLRSDDAGGSWAGLTTGTTAPLRVVRALSQDTIVVGGKCVVLRSDDGGASFTQLAWSLGGSCRTQLRSLAFPVPEVGYVVLSNGRVL